MRSRGSIILTLSALSLVLLTACSGAPTPTPTPEGTTPPFIAAVDDGTHVIPDDAISRLELDADSIRYQGDWHLRNVYLANTTGSLDACVVAGDPNDPATFAKACGRDAFAIAMNNYGTFRYSPAGFPAGTEGATALGPWVTAIGGEDAVAPAPVATP
jgi:hypothetical protein